MHTFAKQRVLVLVGLQNRPVCPLRQFVITGQVVNLLRELALQRREEIDQLMRLVASVGIAEFAVNHFLQDEVPRGVVAEIGELEQRLEVRDVAVQVAGDEHFGAVFQRDGVTATARRGADQRHRLPEVRQHAIRRGQR